MREIYINDIENFEDKTILVDDIDIEIAEIDWKYKTIYLPESMHIDNFLEIAEYVNKRKDRKRFNREWK